jgi:hypothetical protein
MPDWKVTLSRAVLVNGAPTTLETDHLVEGTSRNLAIPMGIDELFKAETLGGYQLVPKEAVDYWNQWRITGGQLYEFQTELEGKWGISFGITQVMGEADPPPPSPHRNGHTPSQAGELPDLNSMLQNHLTLLQSRNAVLGDELQRKQAEFDRNNADIMRISQMVGPLTLPPVEISSANRDRVSVPRVRQREQGARKPTNKETHPKTARMQKSTPIHHTGSGDEATGE